MPASRAIEVGLGSARMTGAPPRWTPARAHANERRRRTTHAPPSHREGPPRVGRALARMDANAFLRAVVHGDEDSGVALAGGEAGGRVGPPHLVGTLGGDRAVVAARPAAAPDPRRGEQPRLAHQPQHPALRSTHAGQAQPRPGLAVALAEERRVGEHRADPLGQRRVRPGLLRPALRRRLHGTAGSRPSLVDRRAGNLPELADAGRAVAACCGGRAGPAHRLDLRRAKGSPASAVRARSSSSSLPIVIAPTLACSRRISSSRSSAGPFRGSSAMPGRRQGSAHATAPASPR